MSKRFRTVLAFICCIVMVTALIPVSVAADTDDNNNAEANDQPTAMFGTPELGSNDLLWSRTKEYPINKSTVPDDPRPHATGTVKVLWDHNYVYARVAVEDSDVYQGSGADHTYDSLEFFVGPGSSGSNQWRVSATGVFSGQSHTDRAAWTQITDTGYLVEMRIPKRDLTLEPGKLTFEVNINNSSSTGADRYEVISAFGDPDTGFASDAAFTDSLELIEAEVEDNRFSVTLFVSTGGTITPNPPGNVLRVASGSELIFHVFSDRGKTLSNVTVVGGMTYGETTKNNFDIKEIRSDINVYVNFTDDPTATQFPFVVWNDNFASGEYTTAVIIDLGEGQEALGSALNPDLFAVSARNTTLVDDLVVFEGPSNISRVYANNEPKVRGYLGKVHHSPDYQDGLASGRYIVIELEFYTEVGGRTTLDSSNSTKQNYNIVQKGDIVLTKGDPISYAVFKQDNVVNPILDQFTVHSRDSANYALYIHKDENGEEVDGLPLYVYTHGFSRGGTQANIDQKASMKSANGSVALMKKMSQNPKKYASHILNISYSGASAPQVSDVKAIIDDLVASGLVDANRIYVSGFSLGGMYTNNLVNTYPGFFAAAAPMGIASGWPVASQDEAHTDLAYWILVNTYDTRVNASQLDNMVHDISDLTNARASRFDSNEALTWPYNQYEQPSQRPNPANTPPLLEYIAHEVEAAVLYNAITMENPLNGETWSIAPIYQSPNLPAWNNDYTDIFDWMFSQRKPDGLPDAPSSFTATAGDRKVTLNWTAPNDDGGYEISGYKVWYGDEAPVTVQQATYAYTFTGLTYNQAYTFHIVAMNEKGESTTKSVTATPKRTPISTPPTSSGGSSTPSGSEEIVTKSGTKIHLPAGTTKDADGNIVVGPGGATVILKSGLSFNISEGAELKLDDESVLGFTVVSGNPFQDVDADDWFYSYVNAAYTFDLFDGTSSTTFSPGTAMTRAMFVQVLANLENAELSGYIHSHFSDVADGEWYTAAVEWAADHGIVNGISADRFDPQASLTREQMLVMLFNYMKYKGFEISESQASAFADESEISSWALEAVQALQGIDLVTGKGNHRFDPQGIASRAEVATIFIRLINYLAN